MKILNKKSDENIKDWRFLVSLLLKLPIEQLEYFDIFYKKFENTQDLMNGISITKCVLCSSKKIIKFGTKNHRQRYKCHECKKIFCKTTRTIFANMHKNNFKKFIMYLSEMIQLNTLQQSAQNCFISKTTSFRWRHKLMAWLNYEQTDFTQLSGIVEMDSTYFNKSFKGQRFYLKEDLNDRAYGIVIKKKQGVPKQKLCTSCAIDRQNNVFCKYVSNAKVTTDKLIETYKNCLDFNKLETVIIDGENGYKALLAKLNVAKKVLIRPKDIPEGIAVIDGIYHLQHVNQLHNYLKFHINKRMHGIASKYLDRYLYWLSWIKKFKTLGQSTLLKKIISIFQNNYSVTHFTASNLKTFQTTNFN